MATRGALAALLLTEGLVPPLLLLPLPLPLPGVLQMLMTGLDARRAAPGPQTLPWLAQDLLPWLAWHALPWLARLAWLPEHRGAGVAGVLCGQTKNEAKVVALVARGAQEVIGAGFFGQNRRVPSTAIGRLSAPVGCWRPSP